MDLFRDEDENEWLYSGDTGFLEENENSEEEIKVSFDSGDREEKTRPG